MKDKKEKKTGRKLWRLLLLILAVILIAAVIMRLTKPKEEVVTTPLPTVSVKRASEGSIAVETSLIGKMQAGDIYYVMPKVAGEIREIYVNLGDTVKEGDPIAKLDNQKQIDAAKIALDSATVQVQTSADAFATAQTNLNRMQALLSTGDISAQTYEQTKSAYDQASAAVDAAKLQLESAKLQYDTQVEYSTVTAPVSGRIDSENMELNAMASQSSQLCVISTEDGKKVTFAVTDRLVQALKPGDAVKVEKQGSTYEGSITKIDSVPSQQTGLYAVEAAVSGGENVPNGASVKVYFDSEKAENVETVPTDAVYYDGGKTYVYTAEYNDDKKDSETAAKSDAGDAAKEESSAAESKAEAPAENGAAAVGNPAATISPDNRAATVHKIAVEVGISDGEKTEILSGISANDLVITSWTAQLYEGAQVQVLPEEG